MSQKPKIKHLEDIVTAPWKGNMDDDYVIFLAVNEFIAQEPNLKVRQEADRLASLHGMGEDCLIDPGYDPKADL